MDADIAAGWCRELGSQLALSTIIEIPTDTWAEDRICQAIRALAPNHRGSVKDIRVYKDIALTQVLFEWRESVPDCFQGEGIGLAEGMEAKVCRPRVPKVENVGAEMLSQMAVIGPEFVRAIGEVLEKSRRTDPPPINFNYRRLRIFSGNTPTPAGEETYDEWVEQAMQAMDEWDIPESQRKQRLTESLRGPASEAVRNLKASQRDCTALDYLNILQEVFGRTETVAELFFQYEHTYQQKGEKMTEYMRRLDRILYRILLKKGAEPEEIDGIRMRQILRGAQPLDPVMLQLRAKENSRQLKYLELIRTVREEEALLEEKSSKSGVKTYTQPVRHREYPSWDGEPNDAYGSEMDGQDPPLTSRSTETATGEPLPQTYTELQKTIQQMQEAQAKMQQTQSEWTQVLLKVVETQVALQKTLAEGSKGKPTATSGQIPVSTSAETNPPGAMAGKKCFGCGELGHFRAQCKSPKTETPAEEELARVIRRILSTPPAGNARGPR